MTEHETPVPDTTRDGEPAGSAPVPGAAALTGGEAPTDEAAAGEATDEAGEAPRRGSMLSKQESTQLRAWLRKHLQGRVSLDVWTRAETALELPDRDRAVHGEDMQRLLRQLASLHPALQFTPYDLDRHADRAAEAGVEQTPAVVIRGHGRAVHLTGLFWAALFPAMLDIIRFASTAQTPLLPSSKSALSTVHVPLEVEAMLAAYDQYSAALAGMLGAIAIESRHVHLRLVESAQFPVFAQGRVVTEVPLLIVNGRRFTGAWEEQPLIEQLTRVAAGNDDPVVRDRILAAPYLTEPQLREAIARQRAAQPDPSASSAAAPGGTSDDPPASSGSGLIVPGR